MTLIQVGDRVMNFDQITSVGQQMQANKAPGSTGRLSVRIHFSDGRHLDFYGIGADAVMSFITDRLAAPPAGDPGP